MNRNDIAPKLLKELERFDEFHAKRTGDTIFDWSNRKYFKAKNYVGVIQVHGLTIEILPKIDAAKKENFHNQEEQRSRQNLTYMLSMTGRIPFHERELASQSIQKLPLIEALIRVFSNRLLLEIRRGQHHRYVYLENNLPYVKGRILMGKQVTQNAARQHLTFVGYDEFSNDTWLNRILKATCFRLLEVSHSTRTQQYLRESLLELADVEDSVIEPFHFDSVVVERNAERFETLLNFSRHVLFGSTPTPEKGKSSTFSLLFPMEKLFEEFIGSFLRRYSNRFGFSRSSIHIQARRRRLSLLRDQDNRPKFQLKPDVIIDGPKKRAAIILDTKWKRLLSNEEDRKNGVLQADIYQLYAYSQRYQCENNILLFPLVADVTPKSYRPDGFDTPNRLRVEFVDLNYNLRINRNRLIDNLQKVLLKSQ